MRNERRAVGPGSRKCPSTLGGLTSQKPLRGRILFGVYQEKPVTGRRCCKLNRGIRKGPFKDTGHRCVGRGSDVDRTGWKDWSWVNLPMRAGILQNTQGPPVATSFNKVYYVRIGSLLVLSPVLKAVGDRGLKEGNWQDA